MKRNVIIKPAILAGSALFAGFALAGDPASNAAIAPASDLEASFGAGYSSDYVFRGNNNGADLFDASIGVSGSGNNFDWAADIWLASFGTSNELDISISASKSLSDNLDLSLGVTNYSYFGGAAGDDNLEPYVSLGTSVGGISLGVAAHYNESGGAADHDIYWEITAGLVEMDLGNNMTLGISGMLGHFDDGDVDTIYGVSAGLSIAASDSITVTPHITHTIDGASGDETVTGVSVGFGF